MENMTKALEVARTLPCACSDCGMRETESAKKILEFAESFSGSVAAPKEELDYKDKLIASENSQIKSLQSELTSIRQQLEQKTIALDSYYKLAAEVAPLKEALKELLTIVTRYRNTINISNREDEFKEIKAIIERARKLI